MSTTDSHPRDPQGAGLVVSLTGLRRRRHLARLLEMRDKLALLATERLSHGLEDGSETFALMVAVEEEIADLYPAVHCELYPLWISTVSEANHEPGAFRPACGICRSVVTSHESCGHLPTAA